MHSCEVPSCEGREPPLRRAAPLMDALRAAARRGAALAEAPVSMAAQRIGEQYAGDLLIHIMSRLCRDYVEIPWQSSGGGKAIHPRLTRQCDYRACGQRAGNVRSRKRPASASDTLAVQARASVSGAREPSDVSTHPGPSRVAAVCSLVWCVLMTQSGTSHPMVTTGLPPSAWCIVTDGVALASTAARRYARPPRSLRHGQQAQRGGSVGSGTSMCAPYRRATTARDV